MRVEVGGRVEGSSEVVKEEGGSETAMREPTVRAENGRQGGCIVICWLVTLRAQMGLESLRCRCRQWNEIRGTEVSGVYVRQATRKEKRVGT